MKRTNLLFLILFALVIVSCKKVDELPPTIVLNGDNPYMLEHGGTYVEAGATAVDDEDGILDSNNISIDDSEINNLLLGDYDVEYSIMDAAGNIGTKDRDIIVTFFPTSYIGSYSAIDTDTAGMTISYSASIDTMSDSTGTYLMVNNFGDNGLSFNVRVEVEGDLNNNLTMTDTVGTNIYNFGTGTFDSTGSFILLDYLRTTASDTMNINTRLNRL